MAGNLPTKAGNPWRQMSRKSEVGKLPLEVLRPRNHQSPPQPRQALQRAVGGRVQQQPCALVAVGYSSKESLLFSGGIQFQPQWTLSAVSVGHPTLTKVHIVCLHTSLGLPILHGQLHVSVFVMFTLYVFRELERTPTLTAFGDFS